MLEYALISHDPQLWLPSFYPQWAASDIREDELIEVMDEGGNIQWVIPNLDGVTQKYSDHMTAEKAEEILKELMGNTTGTLTAEDTINGIDP